MPITPNVFTASPAVDIALPSVDILRALHLRRRFGISADRATAVAEIAFAIAPTWQGHRA